MVMFNPCQPCCYTCPILSYQRMGSGWVIAMNSTLNGTTTSPINTQLFKNIAVAANNGPFGCPGATGVWLGSANPTVPNVNNSAALPSISGYYVGDTSEFGGYFTYQLPPSSMYPNIQQWVINGGIVVCFGALNATPEVINANAFLSGIGSSLQFNRAYGPVSTNWSTPAILNPACPFTNGAFGSGTTIYYDNGFCIDGGTQGAYWPWPYSFQP